MVRWFFLIVSLALAAASSLTYVHAPTLGTWKLAILVGEYGQYLWALPAFIGLCSLLFTQRAHRPVMVATLAACVAAVYGFLRPTSEAAAIAQDLPSRLDAAFGPTEHRYVGAFSAFPFLFPSGVSDDPPQTLVYKPGKEPLSLDFYRAKSAESAVPCVIVIHGGGWDSGRRDELATLDHWIADRGFAVVAIDYRLAPRWIWPAQAEDLRVAIEFVKAHARQMGINPKKLVLFGRSAGGQIATAYAYQVRDSAVRGVVAFYSPHDLRFAWIYARPDDVLNSALLLQQYTGGTPDTAGKVYDSASALLHVSPDCPPTLLVHGELDTLVWNRQSERLSRVLERKGVRHLFLSLPWATHAFDYNLTGPGGQLATYALQDFLTVTTH